MGQFFAIPLKGHSASCPWGHSKVLQADLEFVSQGMDLSTARAQTLALSAKLPLQSTLGQTHRQRLAAELLSTLPRMHG